jgi:hypothetical protein
MKKLLRSEPVAIPNPTIIINKANLIAMGHDARLKVLNQLCPQMMWGTLKHRALLEEMGIDSLSITKQNSIQVPFALHHGKGQEQETALLDTGAIESFINIRTVKCLHLRTQSLKSPHPVYNVDGMPNRQGTICQVCHLLVSQSNKKQKMPFYITNLGLDRFILEYPWCQDFKPNINWSNSMLNGLKLKMEMLLHGKLKHLRQFTKKQWENKKDNDLIFTISAADASETPEEALAGLEATLLLDTDEGLWSRVTIPEVECGWVEFIQQTHNAVEMAYEYAKSHAKEEVVLPPQFKCHAVLFSDEEAKKFPPSQPHDHKTKLTDAAPAKFNMKMCPMSAKEQVAEDKFLDENLEKGYIVLSDLPYGFSTFQVPKKDSDEM